MLAGFAWYIILPEIHIPKTAFSFYLDNMKLLWLLAFILFMNLPSPGFSQEEKPDRLNLKVEVCIPKPTGNAEFRRIFKSLYKTDLSLTYNLGYGFFSGITGEYARFGLSRDVGLIDPLKRQHYGVGGRVGWQKKTDFYILALNLDVTKVWTEHTGFACATANMAKFNPTTKNIEPGINIYFPADKNFFVGFNLSYSVLDYQFDLRDLCLENYTYRFEGENRGKSTFLNFGFGFIYNFKKGEGFE